MAEPAKKTPARKAPAKKVPAKKAPAARRPRISVGPAKVTKSTITSITTTEAGTEVVIAREAEVEVVVDMTLAEATEVTNRIRGHLEDAAQDLGRAYQRRAWIAMGYESFDAYCDGEFSSSRIRLPRVERQRVVNSLSDAGLSQRAIESATGADRKTIRKDLASGGGNSSTSKRPAKVRGKDGKLYPSQAAANRAVKAKVDAGARALRAAERDARMAALLAKREAREAAAATPVWGKPRELDIPDEIVAKAVAEAEAIEATPFAVITEAVEVARAALTKALDAGEVVGDPAEIAVARKACADVSGLAITLIQKLKGGK
jgi:hypothetical protein